MQTDCNIKPYKRIDNNSLSAKNSSATTSSSSSSQITPAIQLPASFSSVTFNRMFNECGEECEKKKNSFVF